MKRVNVLTIMILGLVFTFTACATGPEKDVERMLSLTDEFIVEANKIVEDNKIDDAEVKILDDIQAEMRILSEKFEVDAETEATFQKYLEQNSERIEKNEVALIEVLSKLMECEGIEKVQL